MIWIYKDYFLKKKLMFCSDFWALHGGYVILFWTFLNQPMVPLHIFAVKKSPHFCQLMEMMHASVRSRTWPGCMLQRLFQFVSLETDGPMVEKFNNWSSKIREALQLQPWLLLRRWKDVPSCFEAVFHRQHFIIFVYHVPFIFCFVVFMWNNK